MRNGSSIRVSPGTILDQAENDASASIITAKSRRRKKKEKEQNNSLLWLSSDITIYDAASIEAPLGSASLYGIGRSNRGREELVSAKRFLQSVINDFVVIMYGLVKVRYHGRASSTASISPRIVITKPDGTLLIHGSTKHRPLNWQPPGTKFSLSLEDSEESRLVFEASRAACSETVTLWFHEVYYITASIVSDGNFTLSGSESEMIDRVMHDPNLIEDGFQPIKREFRTSSGTIDLLGRDRRGVYLVLEFKRRRAQLSSVSQLDRYVDNFHRIARPQQKGKRSGGRLRGNHPNGWGRVRGGVVAPDATRETLSLLKRKGYEFFRLHSRSFS